MPQPLPPILNTPPSAPSKRQRAQDGESATDQHGLVGRLPQRGAAVGELPPSPGVRIPAFLNQTRFDISKLFQDLEWHQRFRLQDAVKNPSTSPYRIDRSPQVTARNRYGNVQPWDASRVRLKVPIRGSDYVNASPIRLASRLSSTSPMPVRKPGHPSSKTNPERPSSSTPSSETRYIATQGPKDGQLAEFWNMVMQETVGPVGVIVMLTKCYEGNKEKCSQYFPRDMNNASIILSAPERNGNGAEIGDPFMDSDPCNPDTDYMNADEDDVDEDDVGEDDVGEDDVGEDDVGEDPDVQSDHDLSEDSALGSVKLLDMHIDTSSRSEVRRLRLVIGNESKEIYHYLFNGWPDFQKPEGEDRKALLELMKQSAARAGSESNPRIVHCLAGVGRTGTFIALDFLLQELERGKLEIVAPGVDSSTGGATNGTSSGLATPEAKEDLVYETVNELREQRMMMVMNEIQLSFLYEVIREMFIEKYLPKPRSTEADADAAMEEPSPKVPKNFDLPFSNIYAGTKAANPPKMDEDTVSDYGEPTQGNPYKAVMPEDVHGDGKGDLERI